MVEKVYVFKLLSVFRFVYMDIDDKHWWWSTSYNRC